MKKLTPTLFIALAMFFSSGVLSAQCADGESAVQIVIDTDAWGYEMYWELVPLDQTCGSVPVLLSGGNMDVGCDGDGAGASEGQAYASNQIFLSNLVCVASGSQSNKMGGQSILLGLKMVLFMFNCVVLVQDVHRLQKL